MDSFALRMAAATGLRWVIYGEPIDLAVLGFGSGVVMAMADHLFDEYPDIKLLTADLPGVLGLERRCVAMDYIMQAFPTVLLSYAALLPGREYPAILAARAFQAHHPLWVYAWNDREAERLWEGLGARILTNPWQPSPLGNWTPSRTEHHAVSALAAN